MNPEEQDNVVLIEPAAAKLRDEFLGWQCRLRQMAVRQFGGRPSDGMRPAVFAPDGAQISPGATLLLIKEEPQESTAFFRFQVQKTQDPVERWEKAVQHLSAAYFQQPDSFSDVMTALFGPQSQIVDALLSHGRCVLQFAQFAQGYRLPCLVERLPPATAFYQATYWHNALFNPNLPGGVQVLAFEPDWSHASRLDPLT
jgi:hypothetical protein